MESVGGSVVNNLKGVRGRAHDAIRFIESLVETIRDDNQSSVVLDTKAQAEMLEVLCMYARAYLHQEDTEWAENARVRLAIKTIEMLHMAGMEVRVRYGVISDYDVTVMQKRSANQSVVGELSPERIHLIVEELIHRVVKVGNQGVVP
jgi:hypothetical protein